MEHCYGTRISNILERELGFYTSVYPVIILPLLINKLDPIDNPVRGHLD